MGGRGAYSMSGKRKTGSMYNIGGAPDRRSDVHEMFRRAGFSEVTGTNGIDAAVLNAYAIALAELERRYGAIGASDSPAFTTGNSKSGVVAAVVSDVRNPANQLMAINPDYLGRISTNLRTQRQSEASGQNAPTDGRITSQARYSVTHEYGHMLHNAIAARSGSNVDALTRRAEREIKSIAVSKYGAKRGGTVSGYGGSSSAEFFAESFASLNSGSPNAYGKAMSDWLKTNGIK